jgi:hypothetical protein
MTLIGQSLIAKIPERKSEAIPVVISKRKIPLQVIRCKGMIVFWFSLIELEVAAGVVVADVLNHTA